MPMQFRKYLAEKLDPALSVKPGLSILNKIIILAIIISLILAILETEASIYHLNPNLFRVTEWFFTAIFLIEYIGRVWVSVENPKYSSRLYYILTPSALLDLATLLFIFFTAMGAEGFVLRLARLLRILRIAKLGRYSVAMHNIGK